MGRPRAARSADPIFARAAPLASGTPGPRSRLRVAFESPSAGFVLDWSALASMRTRRQLRHDHPCGGDVFDGDPGARCAVYRLMSRTRYPSDSVRNTSGAAEADVSWRSERRRPGAGHAAGFDGSSRRRRVGDPADWPIAALRVVDAFSRNPRAGTSHYELLRAFADDVTLGRVGPELEARRRPYPRVRRLCVALAPGRHANRAHQTRQRRGPACHSSTIWACNRPATTVSPRHGDGQPEAPRPGAAGIEVKNAIAILDGRLVRVPVDPRR